MSTTQTTDTAKARKAIKAAELAVSALHIGSEDEAVAAAFRAGSLTFASGYSLDDLARDMPSMCTPDASILWCYAVDGFFTQRAA